MGDIARMGRSNRFVEIMNERVQRSQVGKVFKVTGVNLGLDGSDGYAVNLYATLMEVDKRGRVKSRGDRLDVALEDGHLFDPDWTDEGDFVDMCENRFGMSADEAAEAWEKLRGGDG